MAKTKQVSQPKEDWSEIAELGYLAYFASKNGDRPAPPFNEQMDSTKQAWIAVAQAFAANLRPELQPELEPTEAAIAESPAEIPNA